MVEVSVFFALCRGEFYDFVIDYSCWYLYDPPAPPPLKEFVPICFVTIILT